MLLKMIQYYYVGNEDNSQSIIYYNKDTQKLSISRNFYFLNDPLICAPDGHVHEGERPGHILANMCEIEHTDSKQSETGPGTYQKEGDIQEIKDEYEPIKEKGSKKQILEPQKRKYKATEPENRDIPQKTRDKCIDY
jgi:hypothetical protein